VTSSTIFISLGRPSCMDSCKEVGTNLLQKTRSVDAQHGTISGAAFLAKGIQTGMEEVDEGPN